MGKQGLLQVPAAEVDTRRTDSAGLESKFLTRIRQIRRTTGESLEAMTRVLHHPEGIGPGNMSSGREPNRKNERERNHNLVGI